MQAQEENKGLSVECKVESEKNGYFVSGQFDYFVPIAKSGSKKIPTEHSSAGGGASHNKRIPRFFSRMTF